MSRRIKHSKKGKIQRKTIDHWSNNCRELEIGLWDGMNGSEYEVKRLRNFAFEHACIETEYIDIPRRGLTFDMMCIMRRGILYQQALYDLLKLKERGEEFKGLALISNKELRNKIDKAYKGARIVG